jgi:hypothetical protein
MSDQFNHRFTHTLLIAVIVLQTRSDDWYGFHAPFLISICVAWAFGYPRLQGWAARRSRQ